VRHDGVVEDLSDDERYRALKSRDRRFDGVFIVGVRTTGIYCRPSCPTPVQPLRKNIDFFASTAAAQRCGLRACKRCRPDATPGSPEWNSRRDLVGRAMRLIGTGWLDTHTVVELAHQLGTSDRHLRRIMIEAVGAPPLSLARALRAQTARVLIETTAMSFTDIAFASGFASLRQFNDTVRSVFAGSPTDLRAKARRGEALSTSQATDHRLTLRLPFREPIAGDHLMRWQAARAVEGVAKVCDSTLHTALRLPHGAGVAELWFEDEWMHCSLELDEVRDLAPAVAQCRAIFDLDADPVHIDQVLSTLDPLAPFVKRLPGLRSPGSADGFATLIFAVLGQQRSVAAARTIAGRIVARAQANGAGGAYGRPDIEADRLVAFPHGALLRDLDLADVGLNGRAIETIHALASRFDGREFELGPGGDTAALLDELLAVKGIGPWTANYLALRVFADPDVYLEGDLIVDRSAAALGLSGEDINSVRPWRSYLTHHLWAASNELKENS